MKATEMLKTLKAGKSLTFIGLDKKEFSIKFKTDKYQISQGLVFYRENRCLRDIKMNDREIIFYLEQYEKA
jgi:predicted RNA-binding protein